MSRWKCIAVIDNQALIFKRYAENEDRCNKVLNWISKMHSSVLTMFKNELTAIHNKSYPEGKTSAV